MAQGVAEGMFVSPDDGGLWRSVSLPGKVGTSLFDRSEGTHEVAIDEERRHFLADVVFATAIHHGRFGQRHPCDVALVPAERFRRRRAVHPAHYPVWSDLDLGTGCPGVEPTGRVASRPARDHGAELIAPDREFGHRDYMAVGKTLESGISNNQLRDPIELVGHSTLAPLNLTVDTAVGSVSVDLDHACIVSVGWARPSRILHAPDRARRHDPRIVARFSQPGTVQIGSPEGDPALRPVQRVSDGV